ncbi:YdbH domain-containing protein [Sphingomonas sp. H39-1-10]|uniref:YdbH domain-containing protein n=1 Tax=Sphingomonas pollutisoli TaxID=3030829 RepID=UPI0023B9A327|nr:YdbH domain-containing protein [Sphingomonas pollutisoli]MDF0488773.1 YdbH domain-containing protein [Sphingomonas pollutisoli]
MSGRAGDGVTAEPTEQPLAEPAPPRIGFTRLRRILLVLAIMLLVALVTAWTQRKQIARGYVDRFLAAHGVPARYRIADLGLNRQRLTHVVLGDPAHPDLVADWIELDTVLGTGGARVTGLRAGHVRVAARLADGKLSLGTLDRLMPPSGGAAPFALPAIRLDADDVRMRLETPYGVVGAKFSGRGRLDDGFSGRVTAVSEQLASGGCTLSDPALSLTLTTIAGRPTIAGPVRAAQGTCSGVTARFPAATINVTLGAHLERWNGEVRLALDSSTGAGARAEAIGGMIGFTGTPRGTSGTADLRTGAATLPGATGRGLAFAGRFAVAGGRSQASGTLRGTGITADAALRRRVASYRSRDASTPVAPILDGLARASEAALRSADFDADVAATLDGARGRVTLTRLDAHSASGARLALSGGKGVAYGWPGGGARIDTEAALDGGGFPATRLTLAQGRPGAAIVGMATVAPYTTGGATLALTSVRFSATPGGNTHVETRVALSGPLSGGRVERLTAPLSLYWNGRDRVIVNPSCTPLAVARVAVSSLALDPAKLTLCPVGAGLVTLADGRLGGGARLPATDLRGSIGGAPLALSARGGSVRLGTPGFALAGVSARVGPADRQTRLDFAALDGRMVGNALGGGFTGGGGRIANVPLALSGAAGLWRFAAGKLALDGALSVADSNATPRFKPLVAKAVTLTLADGRIITTGTLVEPTKQVKVADVSIVHDLGDASGHADLGVPGITFDKTFQPDALTPLTFGVIADVAGTVKGEGHIRWDKAGITSSGAFGTERTDLAAAFGPVTGIAGTIRFTDLLALESAPAQTITVKTINPGVPVNDGTIRLQTLAGARVMVEDGRWPFAGGALVLEPTLLDFSQPVERHMTFRVSSLDAAQFLQQFDFKNLDATGSFDGVLPMIFDESGGRIENGRLTVQDDGGTIAYVGEVSQKDLGAWGNFAFQALKSLRYGSLGVVMNGPLAGEMITEVKFAGVAQGKGAKRNFLFDRLQKLPLVFNLTIRAPFRQLIDSAQSFYDPKRLIERNLPALMEQQQRKDAARIPVQPPASETVP